MTNSEFYTLMDRLFQDAKAIAKSKGEDYTRGSEDALANFKEAAKESNLDPKQVWYIYARKHWVAINNYIKTNGQSESEPISERIKDLVNYLVLLHGLIVEKEKQTMKIVDERYDETVEAIPNPETNF
jgi:hypothetical protein